MAHTYYFGKHPARMIDLLNIRDLGLVNDLENGLVAFWYAGYVRLRYPNGEWISLYLSSNFGWGNGYWCELQPSNKLWYPTSFLERTLMGGLHSQALNEDLARHICNGQLIPEVLEVIEMHPIEKTKDAMSKQRIQQTKWAKAVKARAGLKCEATRTQYALEACHIKPFAECSNEEAWDITNGICLTASVHTLYDTGMLENLSPDDPLTAIINIEKIRKNLD